MMHCISPKIQANLHGGAKCRRDGRRRLRDGRSTRQICLRRAGTVIRECTGHCAGSHPSGPEPSRDGKLASTPMSHGRWAERVVGGGVVFVANFLVSFNAVNLPVAKAKKKLGASKHMIVKENPTTNDMPPPDRSESSNTHKYRTSTGRSG